MADWRDGPLGALVEAAERLRERGAVSVELSEKTIRVAWTPEHAMPVPARPETPSEREERERAERRSLEEWSSS